jgi:hypothetical protein
MPAWSQMTDAQVVQAMSARVGHPLRQGDLCILRPDDFPGVVVVGFLATDRGCMIDGVFVNGAYGDPTRQTPLVLRSAGWGGASPARRRALALAWTEHGLLAFESTVQSPSRHLPRPTFTPPAATPTARGGVRATLWVQEQASMLPVIRFRRESYDFDRNGTVVGHKVLETFDAEPTHG